MAKKSKQEEEVRAHTGTEYLFENPIRTTILTNNRNKHKGEAHTECRKKKLYISKNSFVLSDVDLDLSISLNNSAKVEKKTESLKIAAEKKRKKSERKKNDEAQHD